MISNQGLEIFYITLRDNERSLTYSDYLKSINLYAKPFYGFDLRGVSDLHKFNNFSQKRFFDRYGRKPTSSEIGCSLSHHEVIKKSNRNKPIIILEDDALLKVKTKTFSKIVELIGNFKKYDILIFGFSKCDETSDHQLNISNPILSTINLNYLGYFIGERLINSTSGALAYYLSVKAKKKISFLEEIYHVADDWNFYSDLGLKIGYIYPTLVIEDLNQKSTLEHNERFFRASRYKNKFINCFFIIKDYVLGFTRRLILIFKIIILG